MHITKYSGDFYFLELFYIFFSIRPVYYLVNFKNTFYLKVDAMSNKHISNHFTAKEFMSWDMK